MSRRKPTSRTTSSPSLRASLFSILLLHSAFVNAIEANLLSPAIDGYDLPLPDAALIFGHDTRSPDSWDLQEEQTLYEPEFAEFDRGIIGRAPAGVTALANNAPGLLNIDIGETQAWVFPNSTLWGPFAPATSGLPNAVQKRDEDWDGQDGSLDLESGELPIVTSPLERRQSSTSNRTLYITLNTCLQPSSNTSQSTTLPPQLELYVLQSSSDATPGPDNTNPAQIVTQAQGGFASVTINATTDVYISVSAPNATGFSGIYNYELAASIDAPYHSANLDPTDPNLFFVDSDTYSALLITNNLTQADPGDSNYEQWMSISPPFMMFAQNQNDTALNGVQNSFCGLQKYSQITVPSAAENDGAASMTTRGLGNKPKEQFYILGLNGSTTYYGMLAMNGNSTASGGGVVGGGGKVWQAMNFTTKADGNCQVIYNLEFCSEVAYAVPSNPNTYPNVTALATLYDNNSKQFWDTFDYSLQQIPCNTTSSAQYSLARNCTSCASAYKQWLCAVTIPRCADFSSNQSYLMPRNIGAPFINGTSLTAGEDGLNSSDFQSVALNQSRNPIIDSDIKPGPYKEVLPCADLCYTLVQSCPAALGFGCPSGKYLNMSYGQRNDDGIITCSYLGAAFYLNGGISVVPRLSIAVVAVVMGLWIAF